MTEPQQLPQHMQDGGKSLFKKSLFKKKRTKKRRRKTRRKKKSRKSPRRRRQRGGNSMCTPLKMVGGGG